MTEQYKSKLGQFGYILKKKRITNDQLLGIRYDLNVSPIAIKGYGAKPEKFPVYKETKNHIILPKYYGIEKFGKPCKILKDNYTKISVKFNGELRPDQKGIAKEMIDQIELDKRCLLALQTGRGKTVVGLYAISRLKRKTLIVVHKEFLMEQWRDRIQQFLPDAKIGYIQGSKCEVIDKDIIIGMIQSLSKREYPKDTFDTIGMTIIDEVHHIGSKVFTQSLLKINKQVMIGLSATPSRKDGLTCVMKWTFGKFICPKAIDKRNNVKVRVIDYHPEVVEKRLYRGGGINIQNMLNQLTDDLTRTNACIESIKNEYTLGKDVLVLSDRVEHVKYMHSKLNALGLDVGLYIGGMKESERNNSSSKKVILATFQMVSEAFDVPRLNTLIMCTPKKDIIQIAGRILRKQHTAFDPLIIDYWDRVSVFDKWGFQRMRYYKKMKYQHTTAVDTKPKLIEPKLEYCFSDSDSE